jgi:hypothetical protein
LKNFRESDVLALKIKGQQAGEGSILEKSIKELLKLIYDLTPADYPIIGEILGL